MERMQRYLFPLIIFLIGFYLVGIRLVGFDMDGIPGDLGDGRLNNYFLEQGHAFITGKTSSYWDAGFYYPEKNTISMSDNLLGILPLYSLLRFCSLDRETAYQGWFLSLLVLNFFACFYCLRKTKFSIAASSLGAYLFAFSMPVIGGLYHIQMLPKFVIPFIFYFLWRFFKEKKSIFLVLFFYAVVYQLYCGIYLGLMSILTAGIMLMAVLVKRGCFEEIRSLWQVVKKKWLPVSIHFLMSMGLLLALMFPYILRSSELKRAYNEVVFGFPAPTSYLLPTDHAWIWSWLSPIKNDISGWHEQTLFMGMTGILCLVFGIFLVIKYRYKDLRIWIITFFLLVLFTLRIYGNISLYFFLFYIPGFSALRALSRIVQVELFFIACIAATLADYVLKIYFHRTYIIMVALCVFVVADQWVLDEGLPRYSKKESQHRIDELEKKISPFLKENNYSAFVYIPANHQDIYESHIDAMLLAQELDIPTVNGYSAFYPKGYEPFYQHPDSITLHAWFIERGINPSSVFVARD